MKQNNNKQISIKWCFLLILCSFSPSLHAQEAAEDRRRSFWSTKPLAQTQTPSTTGSLWSPVRTRMLVGMEGNARGIGDLITIDIREKTSSQVMAETQTTKESTIATSIGSLFGLRQQIVDANANMGGQITMDTSNTSSFNGDGNTSRKGSLSGKITCRVVEVREETGNLVIFGWKEVRSNRETQYLSLSGVVRPQDIRTNNTISSDLIAEAKIEYTGSGVVSDKQGPGFGVRVLDNVWPF